MADKGPLVRVELEFADGSIQRLTGPPADAWLEDVNNIVALQHIRSGSKPLREDYKWEHLPGGSHPLASFENYEGTD